MQYSKILFIKESACDVGRFFKKIICAILNFFYGILVGAFLMFKDILNAVIEKLLGVTTLLFLIGIGLMTYNIYQVVKYHIGFTDTKFFLLSLAFCGIHIALSFIHAILNINK